MPPELPSWFKQRQCKTEQVGDGHALKVSGPNLGETFLGIARAENNRWYAYLKSTADTAEVARTEPELDNDVSAWNAAFELYRTHVIV